MPPSGPSALWSSNNSVQLNTNSQDAASGGGGIAMNNHAEDHDVIGSLGKVLSDVKLDADGSGHGSEGSGGGQGQQGYGAPGAGVGSANQGSWSGLSGSAPQAAGISYNFYGNNGNNSNDSQRPAPAKGGEHDSLQNILYDSGIYEKEEVTTHRRSSTGGDGGAGPSTPSRGERKPSIDMFLSQSPSKTLGEDAFRHVMHRTSSNPSLVGSVVGFNQQGEANGSSNNVGLGGKPLASTAPSSRTESPQTVRVNSTVSSPYNANGKQVYNPSQFNNASTNNGAANNYSSGGVNQQQQQGQLLQPSLSNQFSSSSNNSGQQQQHQAQQQQQQQQPQQYVPMPVSQQQPQVFYMAVPGPDGKQVLQPVQMVQMPGQNGTIMMPVAANGTQGSDGNQGMAQGQHMMLMQPQANNGMGSNMYGQDNGGSNNQYSQYGDSGGYDNMNRGYQSKNNGMNQFGGGGQYQQPDQGGDPSQIPMGSVNGLYSSPQRPPLRALLGNVRRLSRDQVGCRLLQQALDEDGPSAATAILNEGLTFWAEAMVDPFGNYLFQKILERITPEERVTLVSSVSTRLVNASLNLHGTRSVQKIVEVCAIDEEDIEEESQDESSSKEEEENKKEDEDDDGDAKTSKTKKSKKKKDTAAKILTDALKPSAARLCIDSHGNHAIQRILLKLPYQYTQFIFDAVAASVEDVARHRHGCCVIQRCLDSRHSAARTHLVSRIVEKSLELMQDAYGNYVVQYVLDVCGDDEVHAICESVIGRVCLLAIQKFSSNVMEKCLERCTDRVREEYLNELNDSERIRELMMDPFGNYVVQRALSVSTHAQAIRLVETMKPHLSNQGGGGIRNTAGGRRILGKICRRFPNFVLEGETFEDYDLNSLLARGASPHHSHSGPVGGGRRGQNQFGGQYPQGPSPNHRRSGRGGRNNYQQHHHHQQHIPQYQQQQQPVGHHIVQQSDINLIPNAYGGNPYMFP